VQSTTADFGFVLVCANDLCRRGAHLRAELARDLPVTANRKYVRSCCFFSDPGRDDRRLVVSVGQSRLEQRCWKSAKDAKPFGQAWAAGAGGWHRFPNCQAVVQMGRTET
jgi:hypothetical protein